MTRGIITEEMIAEEEGKTDEETTEVISGENRTE